MSIMLQAYTEAMLHYSRSGQNQNNTFEGNIHEDSYNKIIIQQKYAMSAPILQTVQQTVSHNHSKGMITNEPCPTQEQVYKNWKNSKYKHTSGMVQVQSMTDVAKSMHGM